MQIVPEKWSSFILNAFALSVLATTGDRIPVLDSEDALSPSHSEVSQSEGQETTFFPVAVWYSGGKARAPMLGTVTPDSPRLWKDNLSKIKQLGLAEFEPGWSGASPNLKRANTTLRISTCCCDWPTKLA